MAAQFARVDTLGDKFSWSLTAVDANGNPVPYSTTYTKLQDALSAAGFSRKLALPLNQRDVFKRAMHDWLESQRGAAVDHAISDVVDTVVRDDTEAYIIQIDRKVSAVDSNGMAAHVDYVPVCKMGIQKKSATVWCDDSAVENVLRMSFAYHSEYRDSADVNRVIHRAVEKEIGHNGGLKPLTGATGFAPNCRTCNGGNANGTAVCQCAARGAAKSPMAKKNIYFVDCLFSKTLDKVCNFIVAVGGTVSRAAEVHTAYLPILTAAHGEHDGYMGTSPVSLESDYLNGYRIGMNRAIAGQSAPPVPPSVVAPVSATNMPVVVSISDFIESEFLWCKQENDRINRETWTREGNRVKAETEVLTRMENAMAEIDRWKDLLGQRQDYLSDVAAYVRRKVTTPHVAPPVVAPIISDDDDTVLDIENPVIANVEMTVSTPERDFRNNVIRTAVYVSAPTAVNVPMSAVAGIPDVRRGETPIAGQDYVGDDGHVYRAPRNPIAYADMLAQIAMTDVVA